MIKKCINVTINISLHLERPRGWLVDLSVVRAMAPEHFVYSCALGPSWVQLSALTWSTSWMKSPEANVKFYYAYPIYSASSLFPHLSVCSKQVHVFNTNVMGKLGETWWPHGIVSVAAIFLLLCVYANQASSTAKIKGS